MNSSLYIITGLLLVLSLVKSKKKTMMALKKAWKSFENIMPQFLGIIILVGLMMSVFDAQIISKVIGNQSGVLGTFIAAIVGSITLIPGFVAFPTAKILIDNGAGIMQIGAFVSSLMMVGIMTYPVESKYFGKKLTLLRNGLAFVFTFFVAFVIGKVAGGVWF